MSRKVLGALFAALVVSTLAPAGDRSPKIPSAVVEKRVAKLTEKVHWLRDLDEAKALAQKEKKPIFWLHVLGDLDGVC